ncbi:MAG TPA: excisionase family DNA-binding protein [Nitrososphaera sp.]|nr:excisionase family DNA-binding protein [Nitrososphaera sp.]
MNFDAYVTVTEAAELRGVTRQAILLLIANGRLKAVKVGNQYLLERKEVLKFKGHAGGRPPKD